MGEQKEKEKEKKKSKKNVMTVLGGKFLVKEKFSKQFPFIVYVTILLMIIITNTYIAEEKNRELTEATRRLNDLQVEYIQVKSAIMEASKQSVLTHKLTGTGLKQAIEPMRRINIETTTKTEEEKP